ncbi:MAG TPA: accessory factor UbiK family protein [Gammaproteobacteria bacterium]
MPEKFTRSSLDDLARQLAQSLPQNLRALGDDLERNFRALLQSGLERMDLVTREEFDVQAAVLERTREKLEALEARLAELERELGGQKGPEPG